MINISQLSVQFIEFSYFVHYNPFLISENDKKLYLNRWKIQSPMWGILSNISIIEIIINNYSPI